MRKLLLIALLLLPFVTAAADEDGKKIYRTTDEEGNVVYTDKPPSDDAEPVELDPITTVPAVETGASGDGEAAESGAESARVDYEALEFLYPTPDQVIRHNGGQVPFRLALRPEEAALAGTHRVEILLDGSVAARARALEITVGPVNRGPHEVSARVVDAAGNVLARAPTVNFFLLRHSVQSP